MSLSKLIVAILATWRLASLLVNEDGPFKMFDWLRKRAGVYFTDEVGTPLSFLGKLLSCMWCASVWIAAPVTAILFTDWWVILVPFALSTGVILIERGGRKRWPGP